MADTGTNVGQDFTYLAGGAMTQWTFVKHSTAADRTVLLADSATAPVVGVCQDDATSGQRTQVRTAGRTSIAYGGTVTRGDLLTSNSTGQAITYTKATVFTGTPYIVSGSPVYGVAEESGVVSERHMILLSFRGLTS
jgi:hypothetical protein